MSYKPTPVERLIGQASFEQQLNELGITHLDGSLKLKLTMDGGCVWQGRVMEVPENDQLIFITYEGEFGKLSVLLVKDRVVKIEIVEEDYGFGDLQNFDIRI